MDTDNICKSCFGEKGESTTCAACGYTEGDLPESPLQLQPGTILENSYIIGRVLGQGGFGITYLGWDINLNIRLAIKEYFPQQCASRLAGQSRVSAFTGSLGSQYEYGLDKFLQEARTLARFEGHPNIVSVRNYFQANGTAYLVMSYVEGVTLKEYLAGSGGTLPFKQGLALVMPVMDALREVHGAGILHRDISPDNIFINTKGQIVLLDFGAARQAIGEKGRSLSIILKPGYAPEEQYRSRGEQGPWTDIYAIAATLYHLVTGWPPPESLERLASDSLVIPSQIGVDMDVDEEQALLKALAVRAPDRFQTVEEFQAELLGSGTGHPAEDMQTGAVVRRPDSKVTGAENEEIPSVVKAEEQKREEKKETAPKDIHPTAAVAPAEAEGLADSNDSDAQPGNSAPDVRNKVLKYIAVIVLGLALLIVAVSLATDFFRAEQAVVELLEDDTVLDDDFPEEGTEEASQARDQVVNPVLDADYYIDYEYGSTPLSDLPIGARVVDPTWEWEFRTGPAYSRGEGDQTKPVTWLVVARDHYEGLGPHVTLLSEELIGRHTFDNSSHVHEWGCNHWGESGTHSSADHGLRPWLNSTGIHSGEGLYQAFSESFKSVVLTTTLPNKEWDGSAYSTQDNVFLPSTTELGDTKHDMTYQIGSVYNFFSGARDEERVAILNGEIRWYWLRSPIWFAEQGYGVRGVGARGAFYSGNANGGDGGVRPALNLESGVLVSEISP